ncbi:hypothetical protein, partial [Enterobacter hormaechei]|uniref:hypothetical protein n=1 Tax=Enterobacter hormaechei TaxID=158836 RepID=UPI001C5576DF
MFLHLYKTISVQEVPYLKYFLYKLSGLLIASRRACSLKEGANKQVISSQADSLIKISRIWADFFPANTSN